MKTAPTIYESTICGLSFFSLIRPAVGSTGGPPSAEHLTPDTRNPQPIITLVSDDSAPWHRFTQTSPILPLTFNFDNA
ncbi:hypothetical protein D1AOALGA4SA_3933 [Olavius algarvensis Delta 1 endosymbiont]|nr:hypothetical protein D1AOALGA4SA_3933 [Olavius algarvensis Delta 1 endosymbiont]